MIIHGDLIHNFNSQFVKKNRGLKWSLCSVNESVQSGTTKTPLHEAQMVFTARFKQRQSSFCIWHLRFKFKYILNKHLREDDSFRNALTQVSADDKMSHKD